MWFKKRSNRNTDSQQRTRNGAVSHPRECIAQIKRIDINNIIEVAGSNLELNDEYTEIIIKQAKASFRSALISALGGLFVLSVVATCLVLSRQDTIQIYLITGLGTAISSFVSATGFCLYKSAMEHFEIFHFCLARTEIILMEISICKQIQNEDKRDATYADIVESLEELAVHISPYRQKSPRTMNKNKAQTA